MTNKKIVIAGGTGYLGDILSQHFTQLGYQVIIIARHLKTDLEQIKYVKWDGENLGDWAEILENATALINMAGRTVNCRYNEKNKQEIYDSRLKSTAILGKAIQSLQNPPKVWLNSSSATIYRHALDRPMDELTGEIGSGFSVDVCQKWEAAFEAVETPKTRKIVLRTAIVLGKNGGVFPYLHNIVRYGWGGKQGKGNQYFSWIHEKDFNQIIQYFIDNQEISGVFNISTPNPLPNRDLMQILTKSTRPLLALGATEWMVKLGAWAIGTEAELLLKSRRVIPTKLLNSGYQFQFPDLEMAVKDLLS